MSKWVNFKEALQLKEAGFNENCLFLYFIENEQLIQQIKDDTRPYNKDLFIPAPMWQEFFDWLEDTHKIKAYPIHSDSDGTWKFIIWKWNYDNQVGKWERICPLGTYYTRDEARSACLKTIIEILKEKQANG